MIVVFNCTLEGAHYSPYTERIFLQTVQQLQKRGGAIVLNHSVQFISEEFRPLYSDLEKTGTFTNIVTVIKMYYALW